MAPVRAGRAAAGGDLRGKSGLHRARWWVTPTGRKPRDSATENKPPMARSQDRDQVRAKRWGKSPPRGRRRPWHGKPHLEKGHIEEERPQGFTTRPAPSELLGRPFEAAGNGGPRSMAAPGKPGQNPAYGPHEHFAPRSAKRGRRVPRGRGGGGRSAEGAESRWRRRGARGEGLPCVPMSAGVPRTWVRARPWIAGDRTRHAT